MVITRQIKEKLSSTPAGVVLTTRDFGVEMRYQPALAKALSRLVLQGELQKIAKGKYYIPKKTIFGTLKPSDSELVKDFLEQDGKIVGYITGTAAFASMGLTTQISSSILIGTNKYRRPTIRNGVKVSFLLQENIITSSNIPLLRILDALRLIKEIPATSPDECVTNICKAIELLVEINSFANPYPFQKCKLQSFLTEFLQKTGNEKLVEEYEMHPFEVNVLDRRRTLTEKLVSLLRCSLADNYMPELAAKIRHFYDLHFLLNDKETRTYLESDAFKADFANLFVQDQQRFDKPEGWREKDVMDSPIIKNLHPVWSTLSNVYARELPDLAYKEIPTIESIEESIRQLLLYLK